MLDFSKLSLAARFIRARNEDERAKFFGDIGPEKTEALQYDWGFWGRPSQQTPPGDWATWLCLSGRGWGKTRTGAQFIQDEVQSGRAGRVALIAETAADARDVMVEGESGLLHIGRPDMRPMYEPSKRRLTWPNGAVGTLFNAVEPDQLRGPQFDSYWCFIAGTQIDTPNGRRSVEFLKVGDRVITRHGARKITATGRRLAKVGTVSFSNQAKLTGTAGHPVRADDTWTRMGDLQIGFRVAVRSRTPAVSVDVRVTAPWESVGLREVFNITVEDAHEYFANGILVHNCDELAKWRYAQDTWDQLQFGVRLGLHPRGIITTTPRPIPLVRELVKESIGSNPRVHLTRGSMDENIAHLAPDFVRGIRSKYGGTRLGRQELDAEVLEDVVGAFWNRGQFEREGFRVTTLPRMRRIVVAIDPSGAGDDSDDDLADEIGIVVAGRGDDDKFYVLADKSLRSGPHTWASRAVAAYEQWGADRIVAERNFGGAMVEETIRRIDRNVSYKEVTASRAKQVRAEPISSLYEQKRVSHYRGPDGQNDLSLLEDQMCCMTDRGYVGKGSPDRLDALVWALTELSDKTPIKASKLAIQNLSDPARWNSTGYKARY